MAFSTKAWKDNPDHSTPVSAAALVDLETRLGVYTDTRSSSLGAPNVQSGNYTTVLSDGGKVIEMTNAATATVTIPLHITIGYAIGEVIEIDRMAAGPVIIAGVIGVTLLSPGSVFTIASQYGSVSVRQSAFDTWVLGGALG